MTASTIDLLDRPLYAMWQVDSLLALPSGTGRRWIDGYERRGKSYPPVVRLEGTGSDTVTWGEFVETRLLAEYRTKGVPLVRMRPAIDELRKEFGSYPLAKAKPLAQEKELVREIQDSVHLDRALFLVVVRNGQLVLAQPADDFRKAVEYSAEAVVDDDRIVERLHPLRGDKTVVIDPDHRFGVPVVRNVSTDVLVEEFEAGTSVAAIAELYELQPAEVEAALRYEYERTKAQSPSAA